METSTKWETEAYLGIACAIRPTYFQIFPTNKTYKLEQLGYLPFNSMHKYRIIWLIKQKVTL